MSSKPPSENTHEHEVGLAGESEDPSGSQSLGRQRTVSAIVAALVVAGGVAAFLFLSSDAEPPADRSAPTQGLACPHLRAAAEAYEQGNSVSFDRSIAEAAKVAEATAQKSGQIFGEPERIALELDLGSERRMGTLLRKVDGACSAVGK